MKDLSSGLYEKIIQQAEVESIARLGGDAEYRELNSSESSRRLAGALHLYLMRALDSIEGKAEDRPARQLELCNRLISVIAEHPSKFGGDEDQLRDQLLTLIRKSDDPDEELPRPSVPLSESALFVNAPRERRFVSELKLEIGSADQVDLICPFLFWQAILELKPAIQSLMKRGGRLRVLTSTYRQMTNAKVIETLINIGAEVKVSYETQSTRLHAKAWFFQRQSGFSTAFVGSSNLSKVALTSGLEWNVRLSQIENRATLSQFEAAFENYWASPDFKDYESKEFAEHIDSTSPDNSLKHTFTLRPFSYQKEILDRLSALRDLQDRHQNLIVAATGTGKTVIAALDFAQLSQGQDLSLLFVAHRKEILSQAQSTFRHAMSDGSFGELLVDGERPKKWKQVFASVQALAHQDLKDLAPDHFDVIVIDEFHHAAVQNKSYANILNHFQPKELLGLTATPERTDCASVLNWFSDEISAEIRLWDAIDRGLLVPFQYFAVHDDTDISDIAWKGGRYDAKALEGRYDGNTARAHIICNAVAEYVEDPNKMRALGFCAGVSHAHYMTQAFNKSGIPAACITGKTDKNERSQALANLKSGTINAIFCVDVFNEGVDIPSVDTVLFLRPTESATLFIQQLGRGLRHDNRNNKRCLTALDFVGKANRSFRYDKRFRAITNQGRKALTSQVEENFPYLPAGCSIQLDEQSRESILENLRQGIATNKRSLVAELKALGQETTLKTYLHETDIDLSDLYNKRTYTDLRRAAGFDTTKPTKDEKAYASALGRLIHIDDRQRLNAWAPFRKDAQAITEQDQRLQRMFATSIQGAEATLDPQAAIKDLIKIPSLKDEYLSLFSLKLASLDHKVLPFRTHPEIPLAVHATYSLTEIMAAFGTETKRGHLYEPREGVYYHEPTRCNLLFVTLTKDEKDYSSTTMYRDYALSPNRFHWQSQSGTRPTDEKGKRHLAHVQNEITPLMFVRATKKDDRGYTNPYTFLGSARILAAEGERPISIEWELAEEMPPAVYAAASVAVG